MTLQQLHCVEYMNIISRLSIGLRRPALSHVHCISLYSMLICICCKYFLALGSSIAMRIAYHFGRWRCKNWFTEMCSHNSSVTSLLFTLFMIFLFRMPSSTLPPPPHQVLSPSLLPRPPSPRLPLHIPRNNNRWFNSLLPSQAWTTSGPSSMFVYTCTVYVLSFHHFSLSSNFWGLL